MGNYSNIRGEIVSILEALQLSGGDAFVAVSTNPTAKFSGWPAATVVPAEVEAEYSTNAQNKRSYGFNVYLQFAVKDSWETAIDTMLELIDACMDALDQTIDLNGKANFLRAVPATWDLETSAQDLVLVATLHVVAVKDVAIL